MFLHPPPVTGTLPATARLALATRRDQRINAVRSADIELQRADLTYATRASSNNVHFLLARPDVDIEPAAYARLVLGPGQVELPILEYRPFRTFALDQISSLMMQFYTGFDRHAASVFRCRSGGCPEAGSADGRARGNPGGIRLAVLPAIEVKRAWRYHHRS
jgi:hypothetical protein